MNSLVEKLMDITKGFNEEIAEVERERRMNIIAQNGNTGHHYDLSNASSDTKPVYKVTKADERKATPVYSGCITYFPDALKEVSKCSLAGQKQHNHGDKLYWDKNKSTDNADALVRHLIDHNANPIDGDGILHLAKVAWRALATLQIYLDKQQ